MNDGIEKELALLSYMSVKAVMYEVLSRGKGTMLAKMYIPQHLCAPRRQAATGDVKERIAVCKCRFTIPLEVCPAAIYGSRRCTAVDNTVVKLAGQDSSHSTTT